MGRFHLTQRAKVFTSICSLAVVVGVVLLVFGFAGMPVGGYLFGTASVDRGRDNTGPYFVLESGFFGQQTGTITLKNQAATQIALRSYSYTGGGDNGGYHLWGWDNLKPGDQKKFDFQGSWRLYYFNGEPTIVDCRTSGGGGIEGGLRMGPNSVGTTPGLGSDERGPYMAIDAGGIFTGVIGLRNDSDKPITLRSYYAGYIGQGFWGQDTLAPNQGKRYDFRGPWRIYYSGALPVVDHYVLSGGGAGEGGLKMGPNGGKS
ncbi:MAG: hypothetical protein ACOX87_00470 [Chloroflexota bacterium]|jgi:hypothetical protein